MAEYFFLASLSVFLHFGEICVLGIIFWNINNPGGAARDETLVFGNQNFTQKSGFEKCLVVSFNDFLNPVSKHLSMRLTFQGGSDKYGNEFHGI